MAERPYVQPYSVALGSAPPRPSSAPGVSCHWDGPALRLDEPPTASSIEIEDTASEDVPYTPDSSGRVAGYEEFALRALQETETWSNRCRAYETETRAVTRRLIAEEHEASQKVSALQTDLQLANNIASIASAKSTAKAKEEMSLLKTITDQHETWKSENTELRTQLMTETEKYRNLDETASKARNLASRRREKSEEQLQKVMADRDKYREQRDKFRSATKVLMSGDDSCEGAVHDRLSGLTSDNLRWTCEVLGLPADADDDDKPFLIRQLRQYCGPTSYLRSELERVRRSSDEIEARASDEIEARASEARERETEAEREVEELRMEVRCRLERLNQSAKLEEARSKARSVVVSEEAEQDKLAFKAKVRLLEHCEADLKREKKGNKVLEERSQKLQLSEQQLSDECSRFRESQTELLECSRLSQVAVRKSQTRAQEIQDRLLAKETELASECSENSNQKMEIEQLQESVTEKADENVGLDKEMSLLIKSAQLVDSKNNDEAAEIVRLQELLQEEKRKYKKRQEKSAREESDMRTTLRQEGVEHASGVRAYEDSERKWQEKLKDEERRNAVAKQEIDEFDKLLCDLQKAQETLLTRYQNLSGRHSNVREAYKHSERISEIQQADLRDEVSELTESLQRLRLAETYQQPAPVAVSAMDVKDSQVEHASPQTLEAAKRRLAALALEHFEAQKQAASGPSTERSANERAIAIRNWLQESVRPLDQDCPVGLVSDKRMLLHPGAGGGNELEDSLVECPSRLETTLQFLKSTGLDRFCRSIESREAQEVELLDCHPKDHVHRIFALSAANKTFEPAEARVSDDTPLCARLAAGCALNLLDAVFDPTSKVQCGMALVRPPGHHASASRASGFCFFNNVAVAARYAQRRHRRDGRPLRVAIIDWDVHHGNGTNDIFLNDPNVLFFSFHRGGKDSKGKPYYPGTGESADNNFGAYTANVSLEKGFGDADVACVFQNVLCPMLEAFGPQLILVSAGFDAVQGDPLGECRVSTEGFGWMTHRLWQCAREYHKGRILLILEGGYDRYAMAECTLECLRVLIAESMGIADSRGLFNDWKTSPVMAPKTAFRAVTIGHEFAREIAEVDSRSGRAPESSSTRQREDDVAPPRKTKRPRESI